MRHISDLSLASSGHAYSCVCKEAGAKAAVFITRSLESFDSDLWPDGEGSGKKIFSHGG